MLVQFAEDYFFLFSGQGLIDLASMFARSLALLLRVPELLPVDTRCRIIFNHLFHELSLRPRFPPRIWGILFFTYRETTRVPMAARRARLCGRFRPRQLPGRSASGGSSKT